jgi:catechol 2,3-dioxygenase-like lactoylglutathione lyase family enzyme
VFSYVTFGTNEFTRAVAFYDAVMEALGHQRCHTNAEEGWYGWGIYEDDGVV